MRLLLVLVLGMAPVATAQVTLEVYEADGITPFDCNDELMVGQKLTLVVSSDTNEFWSGGLFIAEQNRSLGRLEGRDYDPNALDWTSSHYAAAGDFAKVLDWRGSSIWGFDLYPYWAPSDCNLHDCNAGNTGAVAGDWYVVDYIADDIGDCPVGFYEYDVSNDPVPGDGGYNEPNSYITFQNVANRDLDFDGVVDFRDFALFASDWGAADCNEPNWCQATDMDRNGVVDFNDLRLFVEYWLWGASEDEPNDYYPEDANMVYSIVDANGDSEITIDINNSITLYLEISSTEANDVQAFEIEVLISDINLGSIDNTEHPNGTALILAEPNRSTGWDYWGPGLEQEEGIRLIGATTGCAIADGNLASFEFTCTGPGEVALSLKNWDSRDPNGTSVYPKLESMVIHQVDPNSQQPMGGGESQQSQSSEPTDPGEAADWLDDLWGEEKDIRDTYSKSEWNDFVDEVENSGQ